ncbi:FAD/FMN-containing dehydrogenase [Jatrophihabitans sp. GAS493]|uniref:FAD-binding oxidoreductase n=1 Tax=Jatrophihabitans sp. GAS493 TaxID=1907575 RepID=UPI000BB87ABC|nr:FAD-binding oxidoreductase [Jatrophihabitans sp. GAS493]SOD71950.1 FAD/FMN-containing dehydrogenase [Jatrophihabitans sp. GAS493]
MDYQSRVARLREQLAEVGPDQPVRLRKKTSNLFRPRAKAPGTLDAELFNGVLSIDVEARTADVGGMTTYEDLVAATLQHGLMPLVVPQLKTITLGGAVTGLGIESSSFRNGCPHESVLEMDILLGDGTLVTAAPGGDNADLFYGFPNSYGSLGYALRLRIELQPVKSFVHLRHLRFDDLASCVEAMHQIATSGEYGGEAVDFLDGTWFTPSESYLSLGTFSDTAQSVSDYTDQKIYYRSIQQKRQDWLTIADYIWRWDTDWFWCSRAFGAQNPRLRRLWPKRYRRSDFYWKLIALNRRVHFAERLDRRRGLPVSEEIVQDIEVPIDRVAEFVSFLNERTGIEPVWLCPLKQRDENAVWDLYKFDPSILYVNIGFWSSAYLPDGEQDGYHNRAIEEMVAKLGGRKSLYSTSFYPEDEFWSIYSGSAYRMLKRRYDSDNRLLDLYEKTVARR